MTVSRVAITGMGVVTGFGVGVGALWDGIIGLDCSIRPIADLPVERLSNRIGSQISGYEAGAHFERRQSGVLDRVGQIAVVSAREAMAQAGLSRGDVVALQRRIGVIYGASPGFDTLDEGYALLAGAMTARVHPFSLPKISPAGPACGISIDLGARGPCFGVASACATATHAIGLGFDMIRSGRLDVCIGGGSDASIVLGPLKCWEALRLLATDTARPFSRDRGGLVLGEGAASVVLERWDRAVARGATILGEVVGFGMTADAADMVAPDAESAAAAMQAAIEDAGVAPSAIGYVNAHGTGTRANDRTECAALHQVFAGRVPPTSSLKSQIGHTLNAAGGVETVATVMALGAQIMPATINFRQPDPECDIDCIANATRAGQFDHALKTSLGFGGLNAALVLRRAA